MWDTQAASCRLSLASSCGLSLSATFHTTTHRSAYFKPDLSSSSSASSSSDDEEDAKPAAPKSAAKPARTVPTWTGPPPDGENCYILKLGSLDRAQSTAVKKLSSPFFSSHKNSTRSRRFFTHFYCGAKASHLSVGGKMFELGVGPPPILTSNVLCHSNISA